MNEIKNDTATDTVTAALATYTALLMDYNTRVNLVSRKMTTEGLTQLLDETLLLNHYISHEMIIDAGSGNGLLGIPIAILNESKKIVLVEPKQKKTAFLNEVKNKMNLANVTVLPVSIEEYLIGRKKKNASLISRGFPHIDLLCSYLQKRLVDEIVIVTSENKIKSNQAILETFTQKTYNVPLRTDLKILKIVRMEKTTRGN